MIEPTAFDLSDSWHGRKLAIAWAVTVIGSWAFVGLLFWGAWQLGKAIVP